jgi:hypothetical protein
MRQRFLRLTGKGERTLARAVQQWREIPERFVNAVGAGYWLRFRGDLERPAGVAGQLESELPSFRARRK